MLYGHPVTCVFTEGHGHGFGELGTFGASKKKQRKEARQRDRRRKARSKRQVSKARQQLFNHFAKEYGTRAWPAWTPDRADCIRAWIAEQASSDCVDVVSNMKQFEYMQWLQAGLASGKFKGAKKTAAQRILKANGEHEPVEEVGRNDGGPPTGETNDTGTMPWGWMLGGAVALGAGYWMWRRRR